MSTGIFSIGNSALSAAYTALRTAGNNIANVNTPGYTRQTVVMSAQVGAFLGGSYLGQGVAVVDVRRTYNDFLTQQAHSAQATAADSSARYLQLTQVANLFADPTTGVGAAVDGFFRQLQDLSQRPADPAVRQSLLSVANLITQRFNDVGDRLQDFRTSTRTQLQQEVGTINRAAREIADLNDKIALARGAGRQPNDLLDRRDAAIRSLNESIRATPVQQDDGSTNLFLGNGQPLVVGNRPSQMGVSIDPFDPQNPRIGLVTAGGLIPIEADSAGGGRVGGLLTFLTRDLPQVENELGRVAITLANQINIQHRLGNDRNGQPGGDFFTPIVPTAFPATTNTGGGTVSAAFSDTTQLQPSDYRIDVEAGTFRLTRLADGVSWTSATPSFTQDGVQVTLGGTPAVGDVFVLQPSRAGGRDLKVAITQGTQIAAANPLQTTLPAGNIGSVVVDDIVVNGPTRNANLTVPATLTFGAANSYTLTAGATTVTGTYTPGTPITLNGWSLTLRGTPAAGDSVSIGPNVGGIGDNRNVIRMTQLQNLALVDGGQLAGALAAVVARVGGETQSADIYAQAQNTVFNDALNAESASAGVNLDEEASRLIQYQQQYQAAAKVIAAGRTIFEEILSIAR